MKTQILLKCLTVRIMSLKEELVVLVLQVARKKMSKIVIPEFDVSGQLEKKFHLNREKDGISRTIFLEKNLLFL